MLAVYYVIICFLLGKRHWPSSFCYYFSRWISSKNGQPSKVWSRKEVSERAQVVRDWDGMGWDGYGCFQKWWYPKMDGENNGKTLLKWIIWGENPSFSETPIWAKRKIPEVLDAFVMVQWNMECLQDEFYVENRRIFPLPWSWEEGYFLLVPVLFCGWTKPFWLICFEMIWHT